MNQIIGREGEKKILEHAFQSDDPELIALFGRRRVGKTYLARNMYSGRKDTVLFIVTGMKEGKIKQQLKNFMKQVGECFYHPGILLRVPENWFDALDFLADTIKSSSKKKIVLFFDEFPWMVTPKSELLTAFEYFWNQHCSADSRVKAIICGSSAGWILEKIVNNRGALYNRVTERIHLEPFTLNETKQFFDYKKVKLNKKQIAHLYMVLGGIPYYLSRVEKGLAAIQAVASLAFKKNSFLVTEFENLYATLFGGGEGHTEIARIIAHSRNGIGQEELSRKAKHVSSGGTLVRWLNDLEKAGFIQRYKPYYAKNKGVFYKMTDEYSLFYFHWIEPIRRTLREKGVIKDYWERLQHSQAWRSWAGYAFELVCYKHIFQIMKALSISAMALPYTWRYIPVRGSAEDGAQIDLLFDQDDDMLSVCEIKYTGQPFAIEKAYIQSLNKKLKVFEDRTKIQKQFQLYIISANGLKENMYSRELVVGVCTLDDLFSKGE